MRQEREGTPAWGPRGASPLTCRAPRLGPEGGWGRNQEKQFPATFVTTWAVTTLAPWGSCIPAPVGERQTVCPTPHGPGPSGGVRLRLEVTWPPQPQEDLAHRAPCALQGSVKAWTQGLRWRGCWLRLAGVAELTGRTRAEGRVGPPSRAQCGRGGGGGPLTSRPGEGPWGQARSAVARATRQSPGPAGWVPGDEWLAGGPVWDTQ